MQHFGKLNLPFVTKFAGCQGKGAIIFKKVNEKKSKTIPIDLQ